MDLGCDLPRALLRSKLHLNLHKADSFPIFMFIMSLVKLSSSLIGNLAGYDLPIFLLVAMWL